MASVSLIVNKAKQCSRSPEQLDFVGPREWVVRGKPGWQPHTLQKTEGTQPGRKQERPISHSAACLEEVLRLVFIDVAETSRRE